MKFRQHKKENCANDGIKHEECVVCGDKKNENTIVPANKIHKYDTGKVTEVATCKATGVKTYTCSVCNGTKTETIAKSTTHTYSNNCDTTCNVCGATRTVGAHKYSNNADTSCNECGTTVYPAGNTLVKENGIWYHIVNRQKVNDTTLVQYKGVWYYVKNGKVDFSATTLVKYNNKWWYVKAGKMARDNTLVKYNGVWYHVNGGNLANDTTLVQYNGVWYYVKNGKVDFSATTLVKYNNKCESIF